MPDAPFTLIEYGDYECRQCGAAHTVVDAVRRQLGSRLRFVFRHFPLTNIHPHAEPAAEAAEAAGMQHQFWAMHDRLYGHPHALDVHHLVRHASHIGLDVLRFAHDIVTGDSLSRVHQQFTEGLRVGVSGTPTFFVNGVRHIGVSSVESLVAALRAAPSERLRPGLAEASDRE